MKDNATCFYCGKRVHSGLVPGRRGRLQALDLNGKVHQCDPEPVTSGRAVMVADENGEPTYTHVEVK